MSSESLFRIWLRRQRRNATIKEQKGAARIFCEEAQHLGAVGTAAEEVGTMATERLGLLDIED